jgi:hypothetical protein
MTPMPKTGQVGTSSPSSSSAAGPADTKAAALSVQGYTLEPVYAALSPLEPKDFFSVTRGKAGKDIMGRALDGLGDLAQGVRTCVCVRVCVCVCLCLFFFGLLDL